MMPLVISSSNVDCQDTNRRTSHILFSVIYLAEQASELKQLMLYGPEILHVAINKAISLQRTEALSQTNGSKKTTI